MNFLVKLGALAKSSGKPFPDGLVRGQLIDINYPMKPGSLANPSGKLFPDGLIKGRLIHDQSCDIEGVGQAIGEIIARLFG